MGRVASIPDEVCAKLAALGIPAARQAPEMLVRLFPNELNIGAAGLDAESLARVLIHFVNVGLISLSKPTSIKEVAPGWHFCHFYRDFQHLLDLIAPYIADGLRNGEGCLWVVPADVSQQAAYDAIAAFVGDVDGFVASGQLEVLPHPTWYLEDGRLKSFEQISGALIDRQDRALARGFKFLRAAGDTGWISGTAESEHFIDYEMKINEAIGATKVAAACTYRADVTADELVAIVTAHQNAIYHAPVS